MNNTLVTPVSDSIPASWKWPLVVNMCCVMVVGTVGNVFTLVSLPYVRIKYGNEFSVLQTPTAILLFHLSACDLVYCLIGFPHFIQVSSGSYLFDFIILLHIKIFQLSVLGYYPYDPTGPLCLILGWFRNLVAHLDFATLAAIAVCVCKWKLCSTCRKEGTINQHRSHDRVFGGGRIIFVIFAIWLYSIVVILPNMCNVQGLLPIVLC